MLQPRLRGPSTLSRETSLSTLAAAFNALLLCPRHSTISPQLPLTFTRYASHAAQGRANGPKDSAGRRLGAKKTASEYVIPGNIIFRQRGTKWYPGENVAMGKDHTIYATEHGYVRYYRNPILHTKRRYIGVALEKEGPGSKLPTPLNAPTRRRLGMHAAPIKEQSDEEFLNSHLSANSKSVVGDGQGILPVPVPVPVAVLNTADKPALAPGRYWPSNYEIGKAGEKNAEKVKKFDRKDRWLAWRKRTKKVQAKILARASKAARKGSKGKKPSKSVSKGKKAA